MTRLSCLLLCTFCSLAAVLPGCGGATTEVPELAPVGGTVTLDGKPVAGVVVTFTPRINAKNPAGTPAGTGATGFTDNEGKYVLKHRSGQPGIQPGEYAVTFSKVGLPDGSPIPEGTLPGEAGTRELLPKRYRNVDRTKNTVTVTKEGGTFDFALKSK